MEIRQVQFFLSIVNTGSFTEAADEHYISQSSLSKKIIALEKELQVTLFDRSKRKVFLTEAGERFLEQALKLDAIYKDTIIELDGYKNKQDTLSIAAIPVITQYGITTQIAQFREQYPHIHLTLEEIDGLNILSAIAERRFDLGITRDNFVNQDQYESHEIYRDKLLVVVSKKNQHAIRTSISLKELSKDNFIVFDRVTDLYKLVIDECQEAGFEPTIFYSSHRKVSVFGLVGANIGIALMPTKIYEYHKNPDVQAIPLKENISCNIVLVYPKNKKLSWSAQIFINFIKDTCK